MENYNNGGEQVNDQVNISPRTSITDVTPPYFSKEQVLEASTTYFSGDTLAANVWMDKYCLKDEQGNLLELTPDDMHKRLAKEFARIEQKYPNPLSYEEIYNLLRNFDYIIPGGSILYGVGNNYSISSLGSCFVIGNNSDSYGGIFQTDQEQAQLMKRRAGVGHDISHLRPEYTPVTNAAGTSTGAISFMHRFSNTTREVGQNNRRGALMLTIDINHPDVEKFIVSKDDLSKITGANISVKITDEFMQAVENDEEYYLQFPTNEKLELSEPYVQEDEWVYETNKSHRISINAKELWKQIIHQAWKSAEPGILYWDKIKSESIPSCYGKDWEETSTNPCGEIPLCPYDSCRLMSVNLYSFVENPFTDKASFNYDKFKDVVYRAQRLMDDVIDLEEEKINLVLSKIENDPEPEEIKMVEKNLWLKIKAKLLDGRRTGLSAIGFADCISALNVRYASDTSISLAEEIYKQFAISAYKSSIDMAKERGAFPIFTIGLEENNTFIKRIFTETITDEDRLKWIKDYNDYGRRNIALLTIPPSGTISLLSGISSGIEPVYQLWYKRRYKILENTSEKKVYDFVDQNGDKWKEYIIYHPKYKEWQNQYYLDINNPSIKPGTEEQLKQISPYHNSTAYEINPLQRVKLQATIQKWIDHSISSTINLPEDTTKEQVSNIYMTAWKEGCKGITIYRDNCRTGVLVSKDNNKEEFKTHDAPKRPKELQCDVHPIKIKGEKFLILIGILNNKPYEIFAIEDEGTLIPESGTITKIKKGYYQYQSPSQMIPGPITESMSDEEATITRLVSTSLRHGADIKFIVEQLNKTHGDLTNFGKAIARVLKTYIKDDEVSSNLCPECNNKLIYKDGCEACTSCGYSKCG